MSYFKFEDDDIIFNTLKTHPECLFYLYSEEGNTKLIYNNRKEIFGAFQDTYNVAQNDEHLPKNIRHVPSGFVSLYEMNIDRPFNDSTSAPDTVYPFVTKDGSMSSFSTISTSDYNNDFAYGDQITGSYPLSASISVQHVPNGPIVTTPISMNEDDDEQHKLKRDALRTSFDYNVKFSKRFSYTRGLDELGLASPSWEDREFRLLQIPSIFYGEKIKKGTVKLDWFSGGALLGTLEDIKENGELIVTHSSNSAVVGQFAALIFYSEGFILLPSGLEGSQIYDTAEPPVQVQVEDDDATWFHFMVDLDDYHRDVVSDDNDPDFLPEDDNNNLIGANSFSLYFKGTHTIPTLTLMTELEREECTHSNNSTFIDASYGWDPLNYISNVTVEDNGSTGPARFQVTEIDRVTPKDHKLGSIGAFVPGRIEVYTDTGVQPPTTPFDNVELRYDILSASTFEVNRVLDDGTLTPVLISDAEFQTDTTFYARRTGYERHIIASGSHGYVETDSLVLKNTVKSAYDDPYADYEDQTYISKIAIYDEDRNMIGIAKLATPVKKTIKRDFTFKLKIDL